MRETAGKVVSRSSGDPAELTQSSRDYLRIAEVLRFLESRLLDRPSLAEAAQRCGLSPFHFQRLFARWVGISPKRFLQYLTVEYAKQRLAESRSILDTSLESGLSGPGRLHDLFIVCEAATPGEVKSGGRDLRIRWAVHPSPFGRCFLAATDRGICGLEFLNEDEPRSALERLRRSWSAAHITEDRRYTGALAGRVFLRPKGGEGDRLNLLLRGTNFQIRVWQALLCIPEGCVVSYGDIAEWIGRPGASRAVGGAVAANPVAYLIPCHRVIRGMGITGGYRWGIERKKAMLGKEFSRGEGRGAC